MKHPVLRIFIIWFSLIHFSQTYALEGRVMDGQGSGVAGARLVFSLVSNPSVQYEALTDEQGYYQAGFPVFQNAPPGHFSLFGFYPNPFSSSISGWYHLSEEAEVSVKVYNLSGAVVRVLATDQQGAGLYELSWDGTNDRGGKVAPGIYFVRFSTGKYSGSAKIVHKPYATIGPPAGVFLNRPADLQPLVYSIEISGQDIDTLFAGPMTFHESPYRNFTVSRRIHVPFATTETHLGIYNGTGYDPFFIKGVNLGATIPGTFPGELAISREQYRDWLERIAQAGFNTVRIYTLHYPRFYEELEAYNTANPGHPLYLIQGIWLNEEVPGFDFYNLTGEFDAEIREVVDCVHGKGEIDPRYGKAFGSFTTDVSEWVMAYIIGREIHPDEVLTTDAAHPGYTAFDGTVFSLPAGSPTESWITGRLNNLVEYERETYITERPVSFSSWPTMDPLIHPTELPTETQEDVASFDITRISNVSARGGLFASYHAYPYYPDFISEDPGYQTYSDASGPNSYLGYLDDLRDHYSGLPLLIGEFGVPSSWGNAHFSHSGMHHGHHNEETQGAYFLRQLDNIYQSGCGGAILFSWMDEWFKNTWITEPFDSDPWRRPFWHNITGPEQNFGLIGFEPEPPDFNKWSPLTPACEVTRVETAVSRTFFYIRMELETAPDPADMFRIAFDTYRADLGESILPGGEVLTNRAEFLLEFDFSGYAQLFVTEAYDLFGIWHGISGPEQLFRSIPANGSPWMPVRWKNNRYEDAIHQVGALQTGIGSGYQSSLDAVFLDGNRVEIRIPWSLLQFTDPLCMEVMDDNRSTPEREVTPSDGIALTLFYKTCRVESPRYAWEEMDPIPVFTEREKGSLEPVRQALSGFPNQ